MNLRDRVQELLDFQKTNPTVWPKYHNPEWSDVKNHTRSKIRPMVYRFQGKL